MKEDSTILTQHLKYSSFPRIVHLVVGIILFGMAITGCNLKKEIPKKDRLLTGVKLKGHPKEYEETLYSLSKQKPNKKILGIFRYNMWLYIRAKNYGYLAKREKKITLAENKVRTLRQERIKLELDTTATPKMIRKAVKKELKADRDLEKQQKKYESFKSGLEAPVLLDTNLARISTIQMQKYLFDKGLFQNGVNFQIDSFKYSAKLKYTFITNKQWYVRKFRFRNYDKLLDSILLNDTSKSRIINGSRYNVDAINNERARIENLFQNQGFYNFKQQYIKFSVDSNGIKGDSIDLDCNILNPDKGKKHQLFKIGTVTVEPEYIYNDTLPKQKILYNGIYYITTGFKTKAEILNDFIFLRPGDIYRRNNKKSTETRLNNMKHIKYVEVSFTVDSTTGTDTGYINAYIKLSVKQPFLTNFDLELNRTEAIDRVLNQSSNNYYGIAGSVFLQTRNLARRALLLDTRLRGSIELPFSTLSDISSGKVLKSKPNYQVGYTNSLIFPQFLIPWNWIRKISPKKWNVEDWRKLSSSTSINLNILYEFNQSFERTTGSLNLTYQWQKKKNSFFITPLEISLVSATPAPGFSVPKDPLIQNLFDRHIITNSRVTWLINQQPLTLVKYFTYFLRSTVEIGGFLPQLYDVLKEGGTPKGENKQVFGINYYNFVKITSDYRVYFAFLNKTNIALRASAGFGFPTANSLILPYERRFFVGGANSVRGWRSRDIGPGSFNSLDQTTDKSGDFKLEGSAEWRFPVYSFLKMALFTDFGNVWLFKRDSYRPGATFSNEFYKEFAISSGVGFRFDFSLFVFRLDFGTKMRDPSKIDGKRWIVAERPYSFYDNTNLNIGIGYPF